MQERIYHFLVNKGYAEMLEDLDTLVLELTEEFDIREWGWAED